MKLRLSRRRVIATGLVVGLGAVVVMVAEPLLDRITPYPAETLGRFGESARFFASDGSLLRVSPTADGERLLPVPLDRVSPHVVNAVISAEDQRFREHGGVDFPAIVRAAATGMWRGRIVSGASTLTMQLARIIEPRPRSFAGKAREMVRARQIERLLTKDEVLAAYLNLAPFGGTLRGIEAASRYWFGKAAADLAPQEAALLVAMLPAPSRRAPDRNPALARSCRNHVLARMREEELLSDGEARLASASPLGASRHQWPYLAPHACDHLARHTGPAERRTDIDLDLQRRVEDAARRHAGAGTDGVAVVVLDRATGDLAAMLGSTDYRRRPLNAAARTRSAGSTLKPFLYALAMTLGATGPDAVVDDSRLVFSDYRPHNFDQRTRGAMRSSDALAGSRNLPAIRLLHTVGPERFRDVLRELGIGTPNGEVHLDAALGTIAVSPLGLARAYRRFAAPQEMTTLERRARHSALDALRDRQPDQALLARGDVAWKTGTSSGRRDAWSVGVTDRHVIVVWFGNLDGTGAPDLVGARAATHLMAAIAASL